MTINKQIVTVLAGSLFISISILAYSIGRHAVKKHSRFSTVVFSGPNGWGYDILVNGSLLIHQESIPAIGNGKGFPAKEQAEKAANLVLKKLETKDGLPALSRFEAEEICASLK